MTQTQTMTWSQRVVNRQQHAACGRCGGWSNCGGMSQYYATTDGCCCTNTIEQLTEVVRVAITHFKANGISHNPKKGLEYVLAFQDLIGGLGYDKLAKVEAALTSQERETFVWVNFSTLSQDMAMEIFKKTTGQRKIMARYEAERGDIAKWENKVADREVECRRKEQDMIRMNEEKKAEIMRLRGNVLSLTEQLSEARAQVHNIATERDELRRENGKLHVVKELIEAAAAAQACDDRNDVAGD